MLQILAASIKWIMDGGAIHKERKHRKTIFEVQMRGSYSDISYLSFAYIQ